MISPHGRGYIERNPVERVESFLDTLNGHHRNFYVYVKPGHSDMDLVDVMKGLALSIEDAWLKSRVMDALDVSEV